MTTLNAQEVLFKLKYFNYSQRQDSSSEQMADVLGFMTTIGFDTSALKHEFKGWAEAREDHLYKDASNSIKVKQNSPINASLACGICNLLGCYDASDLIKHCFINHQI